jgi:DNA-binding PadR family transcriptional regulator
MHGAHADTPHHHRAFHAMMGRGGGPGDHGQGHGPGRGFGSWGPFGGGPGFGRRRRMRRGDVRAALLVLLDEAPQNGYGLMQEIERRSDGVWRPSPGSVYPALAQLEDEGLVRAEEEDGRKQFVLTDAGRAHVEEHRSELGEPWAGLDDAVGEGRRDIRNLIGQLAAAAMQVAGAGSDAHVEQARKVLIDARRAMYRILADEGEGAEGENS